MSRSNRALATCLLAVLFGVPPKWGGALAQIYVEYLDGSTWITDQILTAQGANIAIGDGGLGRTWRVRTSDPTEWSIGQISMLSGGTAAPTLFVGTGFNDPSEVFRLPVAGCRDLVGVNYVGGRPRLQVYVNGNITGDIDFWRIYRVDAGNESLPFPQFYGAIYGNVTHDPVGANPPPNLGTIRAYQLGIPESPGSSITARRGDILLVEARRDCFSNVIAELGSITRVQAGTDSDPSNREGYVTGNVLALNGSIGDVIGATYLGPNNDGKTPIRIEAKSGINLIQAAYDIWANVTTNANNGSGVLARLESGVLGTQYPALGGFHGSLQAHELYHPVVGQQSIRVIGDLSANVTVSEDVKSAVFVYGVFQSGYTIRIGGSLIAGMQFGPPIESIGGQVVINGSNVGGAWIGDVGLFDSEITQALFPRPRYAQTSSVLGGGAVGEAPYSIHRQDCVPAHNTGVSIGQFGGVAILRYYGPVFTLSDPSVIVWARPFGYPNWINITSDFEIQTTTPAISATWGSSRSRALW
jgi:hypothetical protein